jgi:hypothetical protein
MQYFALACTQDSGTRLTCSTFTAAQLGRAGAFNQTASASPQTCQSGWQFAFLHVYYGHVLLCSCEVVKSLATNAAGMIRGVYGIFGCVIRRFVDQAFFFHRKLLGDIVD